MNAHAANATLRLSSAKRFEIVCGQARERVAIYGFLAEYGIADFDIVCFDSAHMSQAEEAVVASKLRAELVGLNVKVDVKNQARVHLWYESRFGKVIAPYESTAQAIATWPSTASAIGVRIDHEGELEVCAPFGLRDLFSLVVRPNKVIVPEPVYVEKSTRWKTEWPMLEIVPW
jgi:uncharacterized protein